MVEVYALVELYAQCVAHTGCTCVAATARPHIEVHAHAHMLHAIGLRGLESVVALAAHVEAMIRQAMDAVRATRSARLSPR